MDTDTLHRHRPAHNRHSLQDVRARLEQAPNPARPTISSAGEYGFAREEETFVASVELDALRQGTKCDDVEV